MVDEQEFLKFITLVICTLHSDHTTLVKNRFPIATHLFRPQKLKKICFESQNQSKRWFGWEGEFFEKFQIKTSKTDHLLNLPLPNESFPKPTTPPQKCQLGVFHGVENDFVDQI